MDKKASLVGLSLVLVAAGIVVSLLMAEPTITGFAVKGERVDRDVLEAISDNGEAKVIVILKDDIDTKKIKSSSAEERKTKIKEKQDAVLSRLDYTDSREGNISIASRKDLRLKHRYGILNGFSGTLTQEGLEKLRNDPDVAQIIPVRTVHALLTSSVPHINADDVWAINRNGRNITGLGKSVCIIDTGINYTHESLGGCSKVNMTEHKCLKTLSGYDFVNSDNNAMDDHGHGTHVGSIAAGNGSIKGVARGAKLIAMKVLDSGGSGDDADVIAAIDWCTTNSTRFNISVISMSLGDQASHPGGSTCPTSMDSAMQSAVNAGLTIFAASGNEAFSNGINYPACSPYAIAVGSANNADAMSAFTNTHQLLDVIAPGASIIAARAGSLCPTGCSCSGTTMTCSGTSMATPHAAGAAALIYQYEKEVNRRNASQREVESLLKRADVFVSDSGLSFPRIDAFKAVTNILQLNNTEHSFAGNQVKLFFKGATNLNNASEGFIFAHNFISLNTSKYLSYNKTANITFHNLTFGKKPIIFRNNVFCTKCSALSYVGGALVFNVTGFTNYTSAANAQLQIFDQLDAEGGSRIAKSNLQTYFYANYTNTTSGVAINTGSCAINFTDVDTTMLFNISSQMFEYNRTFFLSQTYRYNISCSQTNFEYLNLTDSIFVSPACLNQSPNTDIKILSGQRTNCTGESIRLRNQSINVYGTLILNNSNIILEATGTAFDSINVYNRSNFTMLNSILNASDNAFTIFAYNFSKLKVNDSKIVSTSLDLGGNSTNKFDNVSFTTGITLRGNANASFINVSLVSTFNTGGRSNGIVKNSSMLFENTFAGNSRNIIIKSKLNRTFFRDSSNTEVKNSTILNITQLGNSGALTAIVNFTLPRSTVNKIHEIRLRSRIYGYVDMPASARANTYTLINVTRFFPVHVNYSNGAPAVGKLVNVTNTSNGIEVWRGFTNANGFAQPNVTFITKNRFNNYTVKINPAMNTSLLGDTPLTITLTDTIGPNVSTVIPTIANEDAAINYSVNISDNVGVVSCRLYIDDVLNGTMTLHAFSANRTERIATPGVYQFLGNCSDAASNYNDSSVTTVTILDITKPSFNETPQNHVLAFEYQLNYDVNGSDNVAVDNYFVNDTANFKMNKTTGLLQNNSLLGVGFYLLNISINDTSNNINSTIISITVGDTTPPFFNQTLTDHTLESTSSLRYRVNASDNVALDVYAVNNTAKFKINRTTGLLQNNSALVVGVYSLNISINDTSNNKNSTKITITVQDTIAPVISNVNHSGIKNNSVVINWTTNEVSNTSVLYNKTKNLGNKSRISNSVLLHNRPISGLKNRTRYFYNVSSCDAFGNCALAGPFNFTTRQNTVVSSGSSGSSGGGGSSSSVVAPVCETSWFCDLWSTCIDGKQERICKDIYGCVSDKVETQSCAPKPFKETELATSLAVKEEPKPVAIVETPASSVYKETYTMMYQMIIWLIPALFILFIIARGVETFPLVVWQDERYIKSKKLEKAEKLYDRMIERFAGSPDLERRYVGDVERVSLALDEFEEEYRKALAEAQKKPEEIIKKQQIVHEAMYSETKPTEPKLSYEEALQQYKDAFKLSLEMSPEERRQFEGKLQEMREKLLSALHTKNQERSLK
jgi:subtilisin family serine protease